MRLGELLSLSWIDVDLPMRLALLRDTKNGESRTAPLSSKAKAVLEALPRHIQDKRVFCKWARSDSLENAWDCLHCVLHPAKSNHL